MTVSAFHYPARRLAPTFVFRLRYRDVEELLAWNTVKPTEIQASPPPSQPGVYELVSDLHVLGPERD